MLPDGNLAFLQRKDKQVMIMGKRVESDEVENVLCGQREEVLLIQTMGRHEVKGIADEVDMSLGNREELSKNKAISRVGDCVRAEHLLLQEQLGSDHCTLVWNEGNHFVHGAERTAHGFAWCLEKLKTR